MSVDEAARAVIEGPRKDFADSKFYRLVSKYGGREARRERLASTLSQFEERFGDLDWDDTDGLVRRITTEIHKKIAADEDYINAMVAGDIGNAKIALAEVLGSVLQGMLRDETQLCRQFADNADFRAWLTEAVLETTENTGNADGGAG